MKIMNGNLMELTYFIGEKIMRLGISITPLVIFICLNFQLSFSQDEVDLDFDAMWDNTIWNEIEDIADEEIQEVDNVTAVAGVRGAEAEDEALALLYYRRSMKGLSKLDLQKALGKLIIKRQKMSDDSDTKKIDSYIYQLKIKIKKT
jgi:hypothetical protein